MYMISNDYIFITDSNERILWNSILGKDKSFLALLFIQK